MDLKEYAISQNASLIDGNALTDVVTGTIDAIMQDVDPNFVLNVLANMLCITIASIQTTIESQNETVGAVGATLQQILDFHREQMVNTITVEGIVSLKNHLQEFEQEKENQNG